MIEVYIYMLTPQDLPFFYFMDRFIARSTICYLLSAEKNTNTKKMHWRAFSPPPIPKSVSQNFGLFGCFLFFLCSLFFFLVQVPRPFQNPTQNKSSKMFVCWFFLVWGRGGELTMKLVVAGLIQIYPSQIWFIWPLRHHVSIKCILHTPESKKYCMLNMRRYSLGMCNFPFRCEASGNVQFSLWWVKPSLQINSVPVQIEGSWVSLQGVLHMFKEMALPSNIKDGWASLRGVLHCIFWNNIVSVV